VTGTNGKSTTTALAGHLLLQAGRRAVAAGNLGTPICELALQPVRPEWLAVELSSFQLHDMPAIRPAVGVLTNLSPDHLDRYPSLEAYYADKALLFRNADAESVWVGPADDPAARAMLEPVAGTRLWVSLERPADGWFDRASGRLMLGATPLLPRAELALLGDHNVANALAAALAARATGVEPEALAAGLASFSALPHRMEPVGERDGVRWINDSKATNLASTRVAVAALDRPFILLLGGRHKGEPYSGLIPLLRERCRLVIAFGEAGPLIARDLEGSGIPLERGGDFADVMERARRAARPGDVVLLSPACSSYDMFHNYEERGARFRDLVQSWPDQPRP
jgi:UDP-N-acetylmuramoylalanine--D-glutamate ligase